MSSSTALSTYVYPGSAVFTAWIVNKNNPYLQLPVGIHQKIFMYLDPQEMSEMSKIHCTTVHRAITNPEFKDYYWKNCPSYIKAPKIIDKLVWEKVFGKERLAAHNLTFDIDRPRSGERRAAIEALLTVKLIKNADGTDPGITDMIIPKGLSIEIFETLVNELNIDGACFRGSLDMVAQNVRKASIEKAHHIVITNGVADATIDQWRAKPSPAEKVNGTFSDLLHSITVTMMTYLNSPENARIRLFAGTMVPGTAQEPRTFANCRPNASIANFNEDGLYVMSRSDYATGSFQVVRKY